jgi:transcription antitermination factor NusG
MKKNWYVVYTKLNCELKVTAQLNKKKIENYCPFNKVSNNSGYKKQWNSVPLFKALVFIRITEQELNIVKQYNDVLNYLFWLEAPAIISNEEIRNIERFTNDYNHIKVEKAIVDPHASAQIISHSHKEYINNLYSNHAVVKMLLPSLGYTIIGSVKISSTKVLDSLSGNKRSMAS